MADELTTYEQHPTPEAVQALAQFKRHFSRAERDAIDWRVCTELRSTCSWPVRRYRVTVLVAYIGDCAVRSYSFDRQGVIRSHRDPVALSLWTKDQ